MAFMTLFGLETDLANSLSGVLREEGHEVRVTDSMQVALGADARIVFAGGDAPDYRQIVCRIVAARPDLPLVLVNRHPESARWLDALDLGAADYCGAPFEPVQIRWVVNSVLRECTAAA